MKCEKRLYQKEQEPDPFLIHHLKPFVEGGEGKGKKGKGGGGKKPFPTTYSGQHLPFPEMNLLQKRKKKEEKEQ